MDYKSMLLVFACAVTLFISSSCKTCNASGHISSSDARNALLIDALKNVPVKGPMLGPPVHQLSANSATDAILKRGPAIVPTLISALDHSTWAQTVWIVFCLKQMQAVEAKQRILKLQQEVDNGRFENEAQDLTLESIILGYLAAMEDQQSVAH